MSKISFFIHLKKHWRLMPVVAFLQCYSSIHVRTTSTSISMCMTRLRWTPFFSQKHVQSNILTEPLSCFMMSRCKRVQTGVAVLRYLAVPVLMKPLFLLC